jgi:hypothetical protein
MLGIAIALLVSLQVSTEGSPFPLPAEAEFLRKQARTSSLKDHSVILSDFDGKRIVNGEVPMIEFVFKDGQKIAHVAKKNWRSQQGWQVRFPDMRTYGFKAIKLDNAGHPMWCIQGFQSTKQDPISVTVYDIAHATTRSEPARKFL